MATSRQTPGPDDQSHAPRTDMRLTQIPVDDAWARKHNENLWEVRRLQWSAAILGLVVTAALVVALVVTHFASWAWILSAVFSLFVLGCFAMIFYIPRKMGSVAQTYATSELVPAIVANVRPRGVTILALVDRAVDRSTESLPTLATRGCEKLPGHELKVGERVPCVAVAGNRSARGRDNAYQFVSPMPVAWATGDREVVRRCAREIPDAEWSLLRRHADRYEEVEKIPTHLLPLD